MNHQQLNRLFVGCANALLGWRREQCPACSERTISLAQKATWGAATPIVCPSCQAEFAMPKAAAAIVLLLGFVSIPIGIVAAMALLDYLPEFIAQALGIGIVAVVVLILVSGFFALCPLVPRPKTNEPREAETSNPQT